jgi:hypothetical protein
MKIGTRILLLKMAFDGLPCQNEKAHWDYTQALFDFEDEIGEYFEAHLPEQHKVFGKSVIVELKQITEEVFKNPASPRIKDWIEHWGKLSLAASFIPEDKRDT